MPLQPNTILDCAAHMADERGIWKQPTTADVLLFGKNVERALLGQTNATRDVLAERHRQMSVEGWTPEHDDEHADCSLVEAAITYAMAACAEPTDRAVMDSFGFDGLTAKIKAAWPSSWCSTWLKPKSRRHDLVRASALLLAEIDRIDRAAGTAELNNKDIT